MQECRLCGEEAPILTAYYDDAFVCPKCYIILNTPKVNHPERLQLRKNVFIIMQIDILLGETYDRKQFLSIYKIN